MNARAQEEKYRPKGGPGKIDLMEEPKARAKWLRSRNRIAPIQAAWYLQEGQDALALASNTKISEKNRRELVTDGEILKAPAGGRFLALMHEQYPELRAAMYEGLKRQSGKSKEDVTLKIVSRLNEREIYWARGWSGERKMARHLLIWWNQARPSEIEAWINDEENYNATLVGLACVFVTATQEEICGWLNKLGKVEDSSWPDAPEQELWQTLFNIPNWRQNEQLVAAIIRLLGWSLRNEEYGRSFPAEWETAREAVQTAKTAQVWLNELAQVRKAICDIKEVEAMLPERILKLASPKDLAVFLNNTEPEKRLLGAKLAGKMAVPTKARTTR